MKSIGVEHLDDLALGSVFLATGGGGDPHVPKLIAREALKKYGPVTICLLYTSPSPRDS